MNLLLFYYLCRSSYLNSCRIGGFAVSVLIVIFVIVFYALKRFQGFDEMNVEIPLVSTIGITINNTSSSLQSWFSLHCELLWFFVALFVAIVVAIRGSLWKIILLFGRLNLTSTDSSRVAYQKIFKVTSSTKANFIFQSTLLRISKHGWFVRI